MGLPGRRRRTQLRGDVAAGGGVNKKRRVPSPNGARLYLVVPQALYSVGSSPSSAAPSSPAGRSSAAGMPSSAGSATSSGLAAPPSGSGAAVASSAAADGASPANAATGAATNKIPTPRTLSNCVMRIGLVSPSGRTRFSQAYFSSEKKRCPQACPYPGLMCRWQTLSVSTLELKCQLGVDVPNCTGR